MIFSKGTKLEDIEKNDPEAYKKLMEEASNAANKSISTDQSDKLDAALVKVDELTAKVERDSINSQISSYGEKLKVTDIADNCIKEKMSFADALVAMIDGNLKHVADVEASFDSTASDTAGPDNGDGIESEPKDFYAAMIMIKKRDNCTSTEARITAQTEFKELMDDMYEDGKEEEEDNK